MSAERDPETEAKILLKNLEKIEEAKECVDAEKLVERIRNLRDIMTQQPQNAGSVLKESESSL